MHEIKLSWKKYSDGNYLHLESTNGLFLTKIFSWKKLNVCIRIIFMINKTDSDLF